jgi:hypothetical protein
MKIDKKLAIMIIGINIIGSGILVGSILNWIDFKHCAERDRKHNCKRRHKPGAGKRPGNRNLV